MKKRFAPLSGAALAVLLATSASAMVVTQTTDGTLLGNALGGGGLTIDSVSIANGADAQFGTYTGFTSAPVTITDGVVLSSGQVVQVTPAFNNGQQGSGTTPSTNTGENGTAEFDAYGPGHISNFTSSNDVAALSVAFTLSAPSQVGFDFIFGSVEFPQFTSNFTDAFVAFLDGTLPADQIIFDASNNAVQVGSSFASALTTADTNSAFADPHGLMKLQTFTNVLAAGAHTITFEVGDVNDHILDSAAFISNFHAGEGTTGTGTGNVPEPASMGLVSLGVAGFLWASRRKLVS
jgi:hypothetical protein